MALLELYWRLGYWDDAANSKGRLGQRGLGLFPFASLRVHLGWGLLVSHSIGAELCLARGAGWSCVMLWDVG